MDPFVYHSRSEAETAILGAALAEVLPDGSVVALSGTLGSGKTRLVQAVAEAAGIDRRSVVSPTFVLVQEYRGRRTIYHLDAYRLRDEDEFLQLGPEEYFEGNGLTLVEWADRVARCLPREFLNVEIEVTGTQSRRFEITAHGESYAGVVRQLEARFPPSGSNPLPTSGVR